MMRPVRNGLRSSIANSITGWIRNSRAACRDWFGRASRRCGTCNAVDTRNGPRGVRRGPRGVRMQGAWYCGAECLELGLVEFLERENSLPRRATVRPHRIPLGLQLLSRQQITAAQLRTALEAQRTAERGQAGSERKIGAWLQELGFANELQITAALARQWSCPVLRTGADGTGGVQSPLGFSANFRGIPFPLLESFQMMPVELVEATGTLLMAFSEGVDYTILVAIEQMLGYRTESCLVCPSALQRSLQALARRRGSSDVVFDRMENVRECAHIIGSYSTKVKAEEIRMARCGEHLWIRLERPRQEAVTLVLRTVASSRFSGPSSQSSSASSF
jgi:hypothetical protein